MPSDYKEICKDNIRRRGEAFEDIGRLLSEQLYNEKSHFVYELLQNAEDALERRFRQHSEADFFCRVEFKLYPDRLEFRHFGELFNENDVKGISDVLKGTKGKDFKQIGTFGIGFKSVYAFTASPEIHSGDEHFFIKSYIRPEAKGADPALSIESGETVFIFPFDHKDLPEEEAFELILNKLRGLGARVLLFLKRIKEIKLSVEPDREEGHYLKETREVPNVRDAHYITVIGQKNGQDEDENWLVFERPVTVPDESYKLRVEVAFRLETETEDKAERVAKINDAPLVVYFPTEKTTRLGFLVQGPYRTTPARDNIQKDEDWNKTLITETAELVVESMRQLKEMDLLSVSLLETLPIQQDDFQKGSMFYPIFSRVKEAFLSEELLPAEGGTFVAASNARLARGADLMKLLDQDKLQKLFQSDGEIRWLPGRITQDRTPDLRAYLMNELDIDEVIPDWFASHLSVDFLTEQSDEWFIEFYQFLHTQKVLWRPPRSSWDEGGILRNKPILRLQNGSYDNPPRHNALPSAYLATNADIETSLPIVKVSLSSNEGARKFLRELGIPELDIVEEVIENTLPKYLDGSVPVDPDENESDLKKIDRAYETDSAEKKNRLQDELRITPFILAKCPNQGRRVYRKPGEVYFSNDELQMYFSGIDYFTCVNLEHPHAKLFRELGVSDHIRIRSKSEPGSTLDVCLGFSYKKRCHRRGLKGFDPDIFVSGLGDVIETPSAEKSKIIWNNIAADYSHCVRGRIISSSRQDFSRSASFYEEEEIISEKFGRLLIEAEWLPNSDGQLHRPSELTLDDLPVSFVPDEKLADQLGMKKNDVAKLAEEIGIRAEVIEAIRQNPEEVNQWFEQRKETIEKKAKPAFPISAVNNSERRQERFSEQHKAASEKEYETRERRVRPTRGTIDPDTWLINQYTNNVDQMICQICKDEMPFKKRNDEYYFEAVEALSKEYFDKEDEVQFLALCPECAARYKEFVKLDEEAMSNLHDDLKDSDKLEIPLTLGERKTSLQFVETHRQDMRTILDSRQGEDSPSPSP